MTARKVLLGGDEVLLAAKPLKVGGQAAVYQVQGRDGEVVKVYRDPPGDEQRRRLEAMLAMSPLRGRETHQAQKPELAWPTALARGEEGEFLGYAMRRFSEPEHVPLVGLFTRSMRLRLFPERADWRFLLAVSRNLAFMTARMHYENLVVGDFSSTNVVVDRDGFVTFLDCDSIAFTDPRTGEYFPCTFQTAEYCAPERHKGGPATAASDDFALAVLIYQLLAAGNHPFGGVPHDSEHEATVRDNIHSNVSYVVDRTKVIVPRGVVDPAVLPPSLLHLARTAFGPGTNDPKARPKALDWLQALEQERTRLRVCDTRPGHTYGSHLTACPWCERAAITGSDLFNAVPPPRPVPEPQSQPAEPRRRSEAQQAAIALAVVFALIVLLVVIAALVG